MPGCLTKAPCLPDDAWNDVTDVQYVLTPPPEVVYNKGTVQRKVLDRIEIRYCDWLDRMAKIERPSDEDIDSLNELIDDWPRHCKRATRAGRYSPLRSNRMLIDWSW